MIDITLLLTIGVPISILIYIVRSDKFLEPTSMIIKTFLVGVAIVIPAGFLNNFILTWQITSDYNLSFLAGFTEEPLKFLAFMLFIYSKANFNEPMDAIVYGTVISLGFATYENIEYVYLMNSNQSLEIAILRAMSAIPLHASCGVIMGYYIGLYTFKGLNKYLIKALFFPIAIHAMYNFLTGFGLIFLIYLAGVIFFANILHKRYVFEQQNKSLEYEQRLK